MSHSRAVVVISCLLFGACVDAREGIVILKYQLSICPSQQLFGQGFPSSEIIGFEIERPDKPSVFSCQGAEFYRLWTGGDNTSLAVKLERVSSKKCALYIGSGFHTGYRKHEPECKEKTESGCAQRIAIAKEKADVFVREGLKGTESVPIQPPQKIKVLFSSDSIKEFCAKPVSEWTK